MNFILSTHNVTLTKAIEDHILSRIQQLEHLDRFAIDARVILEHDTSKATDRQIKCSIRLAMPGADIIALQTVAHSERLEASGIVAG